MAILDRNKNIEMITLKQCGLELLFSCDKVQRLDRMIGISVASNIFNRDGLKPVYKMYILQQALAKTVTIGFSLDLS